MVSPQQSTQRSKICHPAGTTPSCSSSGSVQDGADSWQMTTPSHPCPEVPTDGIADARELPGHSCSLPCASWGGSGGHPTQASHCTSQGGSVRCGAQQSPSALGASALGAHSRVKGRVSHQSTMGGGRSLTRMPCCPNPVVKVSVQELSVHSSSTASWIHLFPGAGKCPGKAALRLSYRKLGLRDTLYLF